MFREGNTRVSAHRHVLGWCRRGRVSISADIGPHDHAIPTGPVRQNRERSRFIPGDGDESSPGIRELFAVRQDLDPEPDKLGRNESLAVVLLLFGASLPGQQQSRLLLPDETGSFDRIVPALISAFGHVDILALGEDHWSKKDSDLRIGLVRDPEFARKVRFIVVEFGSTAQQPTLDRYIRGEDVPLAELQQVWKTTTQTNGIWDSPVYADFYAAVRDVNKRLPPDE